MRLVLWIYRLYRPTIYYQRPQHIQVKNFSNPWSWRDWLPRPSIARHTPFRLWGMTYGADPTHCPLARKRFSIVLYYSVQSEVSAVRKPKSLLHYIMMQSIVEFKSALCHVSHFCMQLMSTEGIDIERQRFSRHNSGYVRKRVVYLTSPVP